jgi:hypothetical protein
MWRNCKETPTKRLSKTTYDRPETTFQDTLQTTEAMLEKLAGYEEVLNPSEIEYSTHTRYITFKDGFAKFCLGGLLKRVMPEYVVFSNGTLSWSVQKEYFDEKTKVSLGKTRFFKLLNKDERNNLIIQEQESELEKLKQQNEQLLALLQKKK